MIRTKKAKRVLTRSEQKHLTEMGVRSMEDFLRLRESQRPIENPFPCFICRGIERKLTSEEN